MDGVRHVEFGRQRGVELVDVAPVAHDALAVGDVEVTGHLVHLHLAADGAPFVLAHSREVFGAVVQALRGVAQDLAHAPLLRLVRRYQLIARVAAPA